MFAVRELEALTLDRNTRTISRSFARYAEMVSTACVHAVARALDAFFEKVSEAQRRDQAEALQGNMNRCRAVAHSLYSLDTQLHHGHSYDQKDALGFINLTGLPMKVRRWQERMSHEALAAV